MRVAVLLATAPPQRFVGGELATLHLARFLQSRGHTVTVYALRAPMGYVWNGLPVRPLTDWRLIPADVVLTHPDVGAFGWQAARFARCPVVAYVHNTSPRTLRDLRWRPPHLLIANSPVTAAAADTPWAVVCRPWVEPVTTSTGQRSATTVVNLNPDKGGLLVAQLAAMTPSWEWLAVAGGHGRQVEMPEHVQLLGQLPHLYPVWERTRLLLFPTRFESYGMTPLEAMTAGIPVVASDLPGVRDALGPAAVYLTGSTVGEWLAAAVALMDPARYEDRAAAGLEWAARAWRRACADREQTATAIEDLAA